VEILDTESPGHGVTASSLMPGLSRGFPWHNPELRAHPELADPDTWWDHLLGVLRGALASVGVAGPVADRVLARARLEYTRLDRWSLFPDAHTGAGSVPWRPVGVRQFCRTTIPELPDIVRGLGISDYFAVVLSSAAIGLEKPNAQAFACVVEDLRRPETAWMIGDNPEADIAGAAANCGIPGVLVRASAPGLDCAPDLLAAVDLIERREAERASAASIRKWFATTRPGRSSTTTGTCVGVAIRTVQPTTGPGERIWTQPLHVARRLARSVAGSPRSRLEPAGGLRRWPGRAN
jgi:putative hydrolase of the HAD superfamily